MSRNHNATLTAARYRRAVRTLAAAYAELAALSQTAEYHEGLTIAEAQDALRLVPGALRVQVCQRCSPRGYYTKPEHPDASYGCHHDDVPHYDLRHPVP